ncbi:metallophosphoesterase [Loktanella salsilacus]|uniref:metallophosphoesterase family protein n=1 Tax=Loktanella salsilacus TaxID=195913 RepID=UPI00373607C8
MKSIVFYGDPHNDFAPLLAALAEQPADCVIMMGDLLDGRSPESATALASIQDLLDGPTEVYWIHGNHETDSTEIHDKTLVALHDTNLHARSQTILGGLRIAGLGGVFRGKVWIPDGRYANEIAYHSRADMVDSLEHNELWRGGVPLRHRTSIFPEDFDALSKLHADILVTHEAPSTHCHGFTAIDDLAETMGVKVLIHGHTHSTYEARLYNGIQVRCVGKQEVLRIDIP